MTTYDEAFNGALTALGQLLDMGTPAELFNNSRNAEQGLTQFGEKQYAKILKENYPDLARAMDYQMAQNPVGWSHPKRSFWTRPKEDK